MRVLFFVETPHRLAGSQRSLLAALRRIGRHGVTPLAVFPGPGLVEEGYRAAGIPTRVVEAPAPLLVFDKKLLALGPVARARLLGGALLPYWRRLSRVIVEEDARVVHFNTPRGVLVGGPAARLARRPSVLHVRGAPDGTLPALWWSAQLLVDHLVLVARALEQQVSPLRRRHVTVVHNGVDEQAPPDRGQARRALATELAVPALADPTTPVVVSLSSVTPFKGLHHLLPALARLRDRGLHVHALLAGGGGDTRYEEHVLGLRAALRLDGLVHMLGFVREPLRLLGAADLLVLPSVDRERLALGDQVLDVRGTEGLPRAILEAMSLGVPVVASRTQGVVEQIEDGVTGLLVRPGDPAALADALARALADPVWRARAGDLARDAARARFSVDGAARGLAEVLLRLGHR